MKEVGVLRMNKKFKWSKVSTDFVAVPNPFNWLKKQNNFRHSP